MYIYKRVSTTVFRGKRGFPNLASSAVVEHPS